MQKVRSCLETILGLVVVALMLAGGIWIWGQVSPWLNTPAAVEAPAAPAAAASAATAPVRTATPTRAPTRAPTKDINACLSNQERAYAVAVNEGIGEIAVASQTLSRAIGDPELFENPDLQREFVIALARIRDAASTIVHLDVPSQRMREFDQVAKRTARAYASSTSAYVRAIDWSSLEQLALGLARTREGNASLRELTAISNQIGLEC